MIYAPSSTDVYTVTVGTLGFIVYGDSRTGHTYHQALVSKMLGYAPSFVINTGDMVGNGSAWGEWDIFLGIVQPLTDAGIGYFPCVGNHEVWIDPAARNNYMTVFPELGPYYSFVRDFEGEIYEFFSVNLYENFSVGSEQYAWLSNGLAASTADSKFVFMHEPHYTACGHAGNAEVASILVPLLETHGVRAVFYGHCHVFCHRPEGVIHYVVTGGGGAPLHEPSAQCDGLKCYHFTYFEKNGAALNAKVVDENGVVRHTFTV